MKIIKVGDVNRMQAIRRFSCEHCGCIFEADRTEETRPAKGLRWFVWIHGGARETLLDRKRRPT